MILAGLRALLPALTLATSAIPEASNTNYQCVLLSRRVLAQAAGEGIQEVPILIKCLEGEYHYQVGAARTALAHIGRPAVAPLIAALGSPEWMTREMAARTLGQLGPDARAAVPALRDLLRRRREPDALMMPREAARALGRIGEIGLLIRVLEGREPGIEASVGAQGLEAVQDAATAVPALTAALGSPDFVVQMYAAQVLGKLGPNADPAVPRLAELAREGNHVARSAAREALVGIGTPAAREAVRPYRWRKELFQGFFRVMSVFAWRPWLAAVVGLGFLLLGLREKREPALLVPAALWALYTAWEYVAKRQGANIRVDLLLIYPVLTVVSLAGLGAWLYRLRRAAAELPRPVRGP